MALKSYEVVVVAADVAADVVVVAADVVVVVAKRCTVPSFFRED